MVRMIEKPLTLPIRVIKLRVLKGRVHTDNPKWLKIEQEYKNRLQGYEGEKSMEFYLNQLSQKKYDIFHDIRLFDGKYYFQMDFLLLCRAFGVVLQVKHRGGEITFERDFNQTTIKRNGKKSRINNPVLQARQQAIKLKKWLKDHNCPEMPILHLFINSKEETVIITNPGNEQVNRYICNSESFLEKIEQIANYYKSDNIDTKDLRKMKRLLLTNHIPDNPDILKQFNLTPNDILTGVRCPECSFLSMNYQYGTWCCPGCKTKSKTAHVQAINEYFLLIKPSITNAELRQFLHIDSPKIIHKLLTSMKLPSTGKFRDRVYHLKIP
jgi:Nuclease-related domain